ncbi:MAG TPA: c-type cytochrome domain-containing protein [Planctomycetota bacterium]|nr:c-type cytochrome domain-containing protein [Planctomycetota bacterium]
MRGLFLFCFILSAAAAPAQEQPKVSFTRIIKPILETACVKCHGADRWHGGLRIDTKELAFESGDNGVSIVPGKPRSSSLYTTLVLASDNPRVMPPNGREAVSKEQIEYVRRWIEEGAEWPEGIELKRVDKIPFSVVGGILQQSCLQCHQSQKKEGGVRLDTREEALKGSAKGPVIVPYDGDASPLYRSLLSPGVHDKNPPRLLTEEDKQALREWINQGATWPEDIELSVPKPK